MSSDDIYVIGYRDGMRDGLHLAKEQQAQLLEATKDLLRAVLHPDWGHKLGCGDINASRLIAKAQDAIAAAEEKT